MNRAVRVHAHAHEQKSNVCCVGAAWYIVMEEGGGESMARRASENPQELTQLNFKWPRRVSPRSTSIRSVSFGILIMTRCSSFNECTPPLIIIRIIIRKSIDTASIISIRWDSRWKSPGEIEFYRIVRIKCFKIKLEIKFGKILFLILRSKEIDIKAGGWIFF